MNLPWLLWLGLLFLAQGCSLIGNLELVLKTDSKVPEASGLALHGDTLYVVSDANGDIYKLDTDGIQFDRLKTKTKDVEGITWFNDKIYLADEAKQTIYIYNKAGDRLDSKKLTKPKIYNPSSGLEGLTYDAYSNTFMVINEKEAGQLLIYDTTLTLIKVHFLGSFSDYSGVATTKDHIWVVSDEAANMAQYDRDMNLKKIYSLGIKSPEGIAISESKKLIYVISDTSSELAVFKLPEKNPDN